MTTAIINLDIINEITHKNGKLAGYVDRIDSENLIEHINAITHWARQKDHLVIHVKVGFNAQYHESSNVSPIFSKAKTHQAICLSEWGCEFHHDLDVVATDCQVIKHRISAFYGTNLDLILRSSGVDHVILTGVSTSMAVELTAREAHDRDYKVTVITDATTCATDQEKEHSLALLSRIGKLTTTKALTQAH